MSIYLYIYLRLNYFFTEAAVGRSVRECITTTPHGSSRKMYNFVHIHYVSMKC